MLVEVFDYLESPPAVDDVASKQILSNEVGHLGVAGFIEFGNGVVETKVSVADHLVERVQSTTRTVDGLQSFGQQADCFDGCVRNAFGANMWVIGRYLIGHSGILSIWLLAEPARLL